MSKPHSGPPEVLTIYYGIHDALRELGDPEHDAGDGESLGTEHTVSGLWDASSALSRLVEQLEAAQGEESFQFDRAERGFAEVRRLKEQLQTAERQRDLLQRESDVAKQSIKGLREQLETYEQALIQIVRNFDANDDTQAYQLADRARKVVPPEKVWPNSNPAMRPNDG